MEVERLEKIKIHELAKKLGVETKKVLEVAKQAGIDAKSHLSAITEDEGKRIEKLLKGVSKTKSMENKKEKNDGPVIIRRAVIINDEEEKKEERRKKEQSRKKDVGFIENNRNKDYNIVYRDKPTKPLTVSELLGIGKKKEPEEKPVEASKKVVQEKEQEVTPKQEEKVAEAKAAETSVSDANNTPVKPAQESKPRFENKKETNYSLISFLGVFFINSSFLDKFNFPFLSYPVANATNSSPTLTTSVVFSTLFMSNCEI